MNSHQYRNSGGKPLFLTCSLCSFIKTPNLDETSQEEGLAPAVADEQIIKL